MALRKVIEQRDDDEYNKCMRMSRKITVDGEDVKFSMRAYTTQHTNHSILPRVAKNSTHLTLASVNQVTS